MSPAARISGLADRPVTRYIRAPNTSAMARPIHQLRNLGPRCEEMLAAIGITDSDQLRRIGAAGAYRALIMAGIARPHRMLLYALGGALADVDCLRLPAELKQDLEGEAGVTRREPR